MSTACEDSILVSLKEQCLNKKLSDGTPSERADIIRTILVHQYHARAQGLISDTALSQVQDEYFNMYRSVVDNFDETKGLNNFAEGALALCSLQRNESQAWKSSLTAEKFFETPHGKQFKELCKLTSDTKDLLDDDEDIEVRTDIQISNVLDKETSKVSTETGFSNRNCSTTQSVETKVFSSTSSLANFANQNPVAAQHNNQPISLKTGATRNSETNPFGQNQSDSLFPYRNNSRGFQPGQEIGNTISTNRFPENSNSRFSSATNTTSMNNANNRFSGRQTNFSFKADRPTGRNELPYNLPPGWDDPSLAPDMPQGHQNKGLFGDQEVPKKPLFSSTGTTNGPNSRPHNQLQSNSNFYRKSEVFNEESNPFKGDNEEQGDTYSGPFKTAKEQLSINQLKKYGQNRGPVKPAAYGNVKKSLGTRRGPSSKFVPPVVSNDEPGDSNLLLRKVGPNKVPPGGEEPVDERLKGLEPKMIELIMNEIMDHGAPIAWDDIAGLEFAKKTIKEIVVWPMLRPDIFTGLRGPPKGLLLFGPPGTGKTLIGKCIASQSKSTFFSISASSLTSKWVGEGEKMVKALFSVSRCHQPAVIFIDEIDSLLSQRTDGEHEASRRIKTEFLVQLDGASTESDERILVIGATNRPQEIDEAARRRFVKRLYIPLPEKLARQHIILNLLSSQQYQLTEEQLGVICDKTDGYSGSDMANLCREAALGPIRSIDFNEIEMITADQVRPITFQDFEAAICQVRASVSAKDLDLYIDWNNLYGCGGK